MNEIPKPRVIDIFAGCGGLSLGLCQAGWQGVFAVEKSPHAFETLEHNLCNRLDHFDWPEWLPKTNHDILDVIRDHEEDLKSLKGTIDLVAGGPPCQGFSIAGRRMESDVRNQLFRSYVQFVSLVQPKLVFFENVKGFTLQFKNNQEGGGAYSNIAISELEKIGYYVCAKLINFGEYGVPQKRTRFILVGMHREAEGASQQKVDQFFENLDQIKEGFLQQRKLAVSPTVSDAISDLLITNLVQTPDRKSFSSGLYNKAQTALQRYLRKGYKETIPDSHSFARHTERIKERFELIQRRDIGGAKLSNAIKLELGIKKQVLVPLSGKCQAPTLTTNPDDLIHYCEPRILTVREYARLQGFPDCFEFKGKYTTGGILRKSEVPRYTQIGNAIPPLFSEQGGLALKVLL